jgi:hypothetical protein
MNEPDHNDSQWLKRNDQIHHAEEKQRSHEITHPLSLLISRNAEVDHE